MRAFLVVGAESSGNRYFTRILCSCGCFGAGIPEQPFGTYAPLVMPDPPPDTIALYRSLPHGGEWIDILSFICELEEYGYNVTTMAMYRDFDVTAKSQVVNGHVKTEQEAKNNILKAWNMILSDSDIITVNYKKLGDANYVNRLLSYCGLHHNNYEPFVKSKNE